MSETNTQIPVGLKLADINLRDFVAPLFRRKRALLVTFFSVATLIVVYTLVTGLSYSSRMTILVNRERLDPLVSTEAPTQIVAADNPVTQEEINSEVELLGSRDVLEKVVIANDLYRPDGFDLVGFLMPWLTKEDRIANATKSLAKKIKIKAIKDSNLIDISFKSSNPQLSYAVLKSLGDFYMAKHVAVHRPAGSFEFFAEQTQKYHSELQDAEDKLRQFGKDNAVAAPDEQRTALATQVGDAVGKIHTAEQSIAADEERIRQDRQQMSATPQRSTTLQASAINDKLIDDLSTALLAAESRRSLLAMKYDQTYPLVREADQEIAHDKAAVEQAQQRKYVAETTDRDPTYELLREDEAKSEADLAAQRATLSAAKRSVQSIQSQMVNLDQLSLSQQDLQREAKADESNYLLYLAKREQERTSNALDITRIANVAIAVPPAIPVLPVFSWPMTVLIAFAAGGVLSFAVAYTLDYLDPSFHTPAQVADVLGIPVVVTISKKTA